ncbi:hypothetical protein [Paenibacillus cymbidii]|uniref:hypothetical protein n=1 Tax=Paenibacillus cymbidii TaxID=1639034 RepID=UPI0010813EBE|nr:hypothetical protein [Paenibacillus cymbidii]
MEHWTTAVWLRELLSETPELAPTAVRITTADARIAALEPAAMTATAHGSRTDALAVKSGLYLWNGSLDASHAISQDLHDRTGSFWHGIMHRMEGDFDNAKYWFRRVGDHPVYEQLQREAAAVIRGSVVPEPNGRSRIGAADFGRLVQGGSWQPYDFVDLVRTQVDRGGSAETGALLRRLQALECKLLLNACCMACCGGTLFESLD